MATSTDVLTTVKTKIDGSAEQVKEKLIESLVAREVDKRVQLLDDALVRLKSLKIEVSKLRPDQVFISEDGQETKTFSKVKYDERKKAAEKVQKLEDVIDKALSLESPDAFQKLDEALKKC